MVESHHPYSVLFLTTLTVGTSELIVTFSNTVGEAVGAMEWMRGRLPLAWRRSAVGVGLGRGGGGTRRTRNPSSLAD